MTTESPVGCALALVNCNLWPSSGRMVWHYSHGVTISMLIKQLVSPPPFIWDPNLTLTNMTFDNDTCDLWPWYLMDFYVVNYFLVTGRQTDRKQCTRAHRAWAQVGSKQVNIKQRMDTCIWKWLHHGCDVTPQAHCHFIVTTLANCYR